MYNLRCAILISLCFLGGCIKAQEVVNPKYDLSKPDAVFQLPDVLKEISGLTEIDSSAFACVQDENGILFIYDAVSNKIKQQYTFTIDGDYEGIARVGKTIYVLRSDGALYEIENYLAENIRVRSYTTGIPAGNNEGLCYDREMNRLLIACKSKVGEGPENKDKRFVYAFDLKTKKLTPAPAFVFDLDVVKKFAKEKKLPIPTRMGKGQVSEPVIKLRTSAIAIHPHTGKLYLLSAVDHLLCVFDRKGNLEQMELLDPAKFNKAEGVTFFGNGDMLITNEGQQGKPSLLRFKLRGQ